MKIVDYVENSTNVYVESKSKENRKSYGQFFTSKEIAVFMANLFEIPQKEELHILDPGAGTGILSSALIERICKSSKVKRIILTCYETDKEVIPVLKDNLSWIKETINIELKFSIITKNYINSQSFEYNGMLGACSNPQKYDLVIGNPPYLKIGKNESEARSMQDICYGAPNLYFLFMGMSVFNLPKFPFFM
ncbi:MAG: N-6 DNA methylase [Bdellovibrionota bacterium]|jgi:adenine-specific DNA-methyltransferase